MLIITMVGPRRSIFILSIGTFGGCFAMTGDEVLAVLDMEKKQAVEVILTLLQKQVAQSAVLPIGEIGWRLMARPSGHDVLSRGSSAAYLITKGRGSTVVKRELGILICDFWGAYNKIGALAKQRCFYHPFTELVKVDKNNGSPRGRTFVKNCHDSSKTLSTYQRNGDRWKRCGMIT